MEPEYEKENAGTHQTKRGKTAVTAGSASLGSFVGDKYGCAAWIAPGWIATILIYFYVASSPLAFLVDDKSYRIKFLILVPLAVFLWFALAALWWFLIDHALKLIGKRGP
jgi:hypothetical protein